MATRRSRPRKTTDAMAVYKAAARKVRQSPGVTRTSPRSVRKIVSKVSPRTSPRSTSSGGRSGQKKGIISAQNEDGCDEHDRNGSKPNDAGFSEEPVQHDRSDARERSKNADGADGALQMDEVIPETPPREPAVRSRKRIVAPATGEISGEHRQGSNDVAKPTKKRKVFQTPPREESSAARSGISNECGESVAISPRSCDGSLHSSLDIDDPMEPPLASVKRNRPPSLTRKFDGAAKSRGLRESIDVRFGGNTCDREISQKKFTAQRSASHSMSLDMIKTSSATLARMFERFTNQISMDIDSMRMAHLAELRKVGEEMRNHVVAETRNIQTLFEMMCNGSQNAVSVRTNGNVSLRDWEKLLDGLTPYATLVFSKDLFSRILSFNAPLKAVDTFAKYGECRMSDVERSSLSARTLLFRLQPADKKFQYLEDVGKLHSDFKFSVVRNAFFNVGLDTFGMFKARNDSKENRGDEERIGEHQKLRGKLSRPSWLAEGSVTLDHISQARAFSETPGQSRKERIRRTPSPDDIACHGALRVYRQLSKILHDGRGNLRVVFFQSLGYLLLPWKGRTADVDQRTMKLEFLEEDGSEEPNLTLSIDEVQFTSQCPQNADHETVSTADATNKKLLRDLFGQWRTMVLAVDHDVIVTHGGQQKTAQSETKPLHRLIHMIDVALDC